ADELAKRKMPASLTLIDSPGGKYETAGLIEENAAILEKAGVPVAINTDDFITESRFFLRTGAIALRGGMSEAAALKALTLAPAAMLHLEKHVGSLEVGKDADFAVLSGPPFSVYTQVLETYIDGQQVFERKRDWPYQAGGFAVADKARLPQMAEPVTAHDPPMNGWGAMAAAPVNPADGKLAILAGRAYTVGRGTIENCVILIENGRITAVGPKSEVRIPTDARPILA